MVFYRSLASSVIALASVFSCAAVAEEVEHTNVVVIMADDLGYECIGANGGASYKTPRLDELARQGMRFEHCFVQPRCTPTRVQLMTGLYNVRNYTKFGELERSQTTFAHAFKKAGYATCIAGKWQLGSNMSLPKHFGFDEYCLWQLDRRPPRYANPGLEVNGKRVDFSDGEYGPDIINKYAVDFIGRHREKPFLLYYPMILPHFPHQPTPDSDDWDPTLRGERTNDNVEHFADMVAYMDKLVGNVLDALDEHGLRENTLVIFLGDNGTDVKITSRVGDREVRGGKGEATANGYHVPLIAGWPGTVPAGKICGDLVDSTDFFPTICHAAGVAIPQGAALDGQTFLPQLKGEAGTPRQSVYIWYAREGGETAQFEFARDRRYKLSRNGRFFDLQLDPREEAPLAEDAIVGEAAQAREKLQRTLDKYRDQRFSHVLKQAAPE